MLDLLKANHDARLHWRARRKQEAHRGRAVLRAAKKALDKAATTTAVRGLPPLSRIEGCRTELLVYVQYHNS